MNMCFKDISGGGGSDCEWETVPQFMANNRKSSLTFGEVFCKPTASASVCVDEANLTFVCRLFLEEKTTERT